ncbi:MAG: hypothetical protein U1F76_18970 [Candidatus Competibacteraceae bacterium]
MPSRRWEAGDTLLPLPVPLLMKAATKVMTQMFSRRDVQLFRLSSDYTV